MRARNALGYDELERFVAEADRVAFIMRTFISGKGLFGGSAEEAADSLSRIANKHNVHKIHVVIPTESNESAQMRIDDTGHGNEDNKNNYSYAFNELRRSVIEECEVAAAADVHVAKKLYLYQYEGDFCYNIIYNSRLALLGNYWHSKKSIDVAQLEIDTHDPWWPVVQADISHILGRLGKRHRRLIPIIHPE